MDAHRKLRTWKLGCELVCKIYRITDAFPQSERFGLVTQLRDASVSIPSNVAEGSGRSTKKDYVRFLHQALGSAREVDTQLYVATSVGMLDPDRYEEILEELEKLTAHLQAQINSLK